MKHTTYCLFLLVLAVPATAVSISICTDRPDALYKAGDEIVFIISGAENGTLEHRLTDGAAVLKKGSIPCDTGPIEIPATLDKPGFLVCSVTFTPAGEEPIENAVAAAGVDPENIRPAAEHMPADFDTFWQRKKQELAAVPMHPVLTAEPNEPGMEIFDVSLDALNGIAVKGYYARPVNAAKGSCPAIAFYQGAGVYSAYKDGIREYCKEGFIAFEINAHGMPNGLPREYYQNLHQTTMKKYQYVGREDREKSYFVGMFLRAYRALEFLKAQPEWDGRHLVVWGGSQGGAQSIAAAGLDPEVTYVFAGVPAMCDHGGAVSGWPRLVPIEEDGRYNLTVLNASKYVDAVNFAAHITAPGFFTVGYIDRTCRPTSVYAMYNTYAGPKEMLHVPLMGHELTPEQTQTAKEKILGHVKQSLSDLH